MPSVSNGKTLVVEADNYTIRIAGRDVKNTSAQVSTALSFAPSEYGVTFTLNGGEALPGVVQVEMTGDNAVYTRVYLHNALKASGSSSTATRTMSSRRTRRANTC